MGGYRREGGCLCGTIRFVVTAPPTEVGYCHCTRCQRRTGTAASVNATIDGREFRLLSGAEDLSCWRPPGGGAEKCFCARCGSQICSQDPDDHSRMSVRLAAFDQDPGVPPSYHQYVAYAAAWEPIPDDGLPRFPESRFDV
jgi:hypothetical protein